jgi:hypothetical protein
MSGHSQDNKTKSTVTIDIEHARIHDGKHYFLSEYIQEVENAAHKYWLVEVADSDPHVTAVINCTQGGKFSLFEGSTYTTTAAVVYAINNDRNNANDTATKFYSPNTTSLYSITTTGTAIFVGNIGSQKEGGILDRQREIILKKNTKYIVDFLSYAASNTVSVLFEYYYDE